MNETTTPKDLVGELRASGYTIQVGEHAIGFPLDAETWELFWPVFALGIVQEERARLRAAVEELSKRDGDWLRRSDVLALLGET